MKLSNKDKKIWQFSVCGSKHAVKIAMIYSLLDGSSTQISDEHLDAAIAYLDEDPHTTLVLSDFWLVLGLFIFGCFLGSMVLVLSRL